MNATKKLAAALLFLIIASSFTITGLAKERKISSIGNDRRTFAFVLYYGNGCPHCKIVEEYLDQNDPENKLGVIQKEIWSNPANKNEMVELARACGLDMGKLGVPMLQDKETGKCYGGQTDKGSDEIINFLARNK